jgi:hypothetical protein
MKYIYYMQHKGDLQFIYNWLKLLQLAKSQLL